MRRTRLQGAYAIVTYTDIPDPAGYKANVLDKGPAIIEKNGGHLLVATNDIKRIGIIGFDSIEQAKEWYASPDMKDIRAYINENTKGRVFAVKAR
jgi:uncharacterized protein (DUF1330 family)